jgi:hypothetical protein
VAARTLVQEARALMRERNYSDACKKLEESVRLQAGIGEASIITQFDLADCNERIGKLATAWRGFQAVASQSKGADQSDRAKAAKKRARALESRLPKLVIAVPSAGQGLEVSRDGVALDSAGWGAVLLVDPGTHRVTATAPGKKPWLTMVQAREGATTRVQVPRDLPATIDAVATSAAPSPAAPSPAEAAQAAPSPAAPPEPSGTEECAAPSAPHPPAKGLSLAEGIRLAQGLPPTEPTDPTEPTETTETEIDDEPGPTRRVMGWAVARVVDGATLMGGLVSGLMTPKPR